MRALGHIAGALLFVAVWAPAAHAQYDAHWVTGRDNSGVLIDFRQTPPKLSCGAGLTALEGSATWSDALTGDLLLFSNGIEVRTPSGLLTNGGGLSGNSTATETTLFAPVPGTNAQRLFVFVNSGSKVYYSIIDIPSSTVLAAHKNVLVASDTGEGMGAVAHANGDDFWLVVANMGSDTLDSYRVSGDPAGATAVPFPAMPTVSTPLPALQSMAAGSRLSVVFSRDTKRLVLPLESSDIWLLAFDNATGTPSTPTKIFDGKGYSAAFSPDGEMVYFCSGGGKNGYSADLQQHDIVNKTTTALTTTGGWGGVALGPDDRIYVTGNAKTALTVVDNPNVGGSTNVSTLPLPAPCTGGYNLSKQIDLAGTKLVPCVDDGSGVRDTGCTAQTPVCKGSGLSAACVQCEDDNATPGGADFGCLGECDPATNTCKPLSPDAGVDSGAGDGGVDSGEDGGAADMGSDSAVDAQVFADGGAPDISTDSGQTAADGGCCDVAGGNRDGALMLVMLLGLALLLRRPRRR